MRIIALLIFNFLLVNSYAQELSIIPQPVSSIRNKGNFTLSSKTKLLITDEGENLSAAFLNNYLKQYYGFSLKQVKKASSNYISITTKRFIQAPANEGHYQLMASHAAIIISGDSYKGSFYGIQTLIQLLPTKPSTKLLVPCASIDDYPRFNYRGLHLDVVRHFFSLSYVKKYIDYIALHKMNTFHWHLTDDQGWRIQIKKYPKLTEVGGCRNGTIIGRYPGTGNDSIHYCGYYTQEEIKEIVKYAADRYITVIPEIEMPGHASAAIAAYPSLSCFPEENTKPPAKSPWRNGDTTGKQVQQTWGIFEDIFCPSDYTFNFLQDVLDEVMDLFPSQYIHIGGDECPKANWKRSDFCQQLMREKGLKDEHELQSYFVQRIEKYVNSKGRQIIGWDEILEGGLAPNATVMSWRGEKGGIAAATQDHHVIMTPSSHLYFDHKETEKEDSITIGGYTSLQKTYSYEPLSDKIPAGKEEYILGAQANLWAEYIQNTNKVEYLLFPRLSALSEVLWSPKEKRDYKGFEKRMITQVNRYSLWGSNYNKCFN